MNKGYLPLQHHYRLIENHTPLMRWDGKEDFTVWQKRAKEKLEEEVDYIIDHCRIVADKIYDKVIFKL